ncbi:Shedu immune nuclease family protein [Paucibacter sp. KCTC 42545]|uniref:Shedu immune nuclease family protein n=1 Tax=Paucibacter sp. KCTC 42545 TaxID=1768242 RepID=UPI000733C457|nr:Shedu immune nuclease family protein [Paucibacter sp. KCTC 42545]ALT79103.1 hypothetical protein AT984_19830 [Paucibacter sp. KCTC 42545]
MATKSVWQALGIQDQLADRITFDCEKCAEGGTDVYFHLMPPPNHLMDMVRRWRLMTVADGLLTIYPFKSTVNGYEPKYEGIDRIVIGRRRHDAWEEPEGDGDVQSLLERLPEGLETNPLNGLGFTSLDRSIPQSIAAAASGVLIFIQGGDKPPYLKDDLYVISELYLKRLVRGMRSISSRHQRQARTEKLILAHNSLLSAMDENKFPPRQKKLSPEAMYELVQVGRNYAGIPKTSQRSVVGMVSENAQAIAKNAPDVLYELAAKIERVTLQEMIAKYEDMLTKGLKETKWQRFFEANTFILSLVFTVPTVFVQETPYVHGKRVDGKGGRFSDFLMRGQGTGNVALIEIKSPETDLLTAYRAEQPCPSTELVGSITQVLGQRRRLTTGWHNLKGEDNGALSNAELYSPQAVVLIGKTPTAKAEREAFEAFRNVVKDVAVITFDELLLRLQYLYEALAAQPAPPPLDVAPPSPDATEGGDESTDLF